MNYTMLILNINALACFLTTVRLLSFRRGKGRHRPLVSWCAYILIVACATVFIRIITGKYHHADWGETAINIMLSIVILLSKGNITHLFKSK